MSRSLQKNDISENHANSRTCFVTVGATASFLPLLEEVLSPAFLDHLAGQGFLTLLVQTGPDHNWAEQRMDELRMQIKSSWPAIEIFPYVTDVAVKMLPCRSELGHHRSGVMISHAGSGSILDAARMDVPLIVIPNRSLLGNHQEELACAVDAAGWAVKGNLSCLSEAVTRTLLFADQQPEFQPHSEPQFPTASLDRSGLFDFAAMAANQTMESYQLD